MDKKVKIKLTIKINNMKTRLATEKEISPVIISAVDLMKRK